MNTLASYLNGETSVCRMKRTRSHYNLHPEQRSTAPKMMRAVTNDDYPAHVPEGYSSQHIIEELQRIAREQEEQRDSRYHNDVMKRITSGTWNETLSRQE
jgi:cell division protein YceG involved in septum cleavage